MKIKAENLWPLIMDFIEKFFGDDDLKSFVKYFDLDINHQVSPISILLIYNTYTTDNEANTIFFSLHAINPLIHRL